MKRGSYAKSPAIREQILTTALELIGEHGVSQATLTEIADTVGMSRAGVLHHFGSREALFEAVLDRRDGGNGGWKSMDMDSLQPMGSMDGFFTAIQNNARVPGLVALFSAFIGRVAAEADGDPGRDWAIARYERVVAVMKATILADPAWTDARIDAETAARVLTATADGLQTQWLLGADIDMAGVLRVLWRSWTE